ncbi:MAG TPA: hypothetical protein VMH38_06440 [Thermoplasmata archaeon]|nr:hypothetical protein [Thermoplasmata archaeon]
MSIDQDYPMSPTQKRVLVIGLVVLGVCFAALFGGFVPGLKPNLTNPSTIVIDGESYYYSAVVLNLPLAFTNHTSPQAFLFHNVSFSLWVTNWGGPSGGLVRGNITEPNGTVSSFVLGEAVMASQNSTLYVTPDHLAAVYWGGGVFGGPRVWLMVLA